MNIESSNDACAEEVEEYARTRKMITQNNKASKALKLEYQSFENDMLQSKLEAAEEELFSSLRSDVEKLFDVPQHTAAGTNKVAFADEDLKKLQPILGVPSDGGAYSIVVVAQKLLDFQQQCSEDALIRTTLLNRIQELDTTAQNLRKEMEKLVFKHEDEVRALEEELRDHSVRADHNAKAHEKYQIVSAENEQLKLRVAELEASASASQTEQELEELQEKLSEAEEVQDNLVKKNSEFARQLAALQEHDTEQQKEIAELNTELASARISDNQLKAAQEEISRLKEKVQGGIQLARDTEQKVEEIKEMACAGVQSLLVVIGETGDRANNSITAEMVSKHWSHIARLSSHLFNCQQLNVWSHPMQPDFTSDQNIPRHSFFAAHIPEDILQHGTPQIPLAAVVLYGLTASEVGQYDEESMVQALAYLETFIARLHRILDGEEAMTAGVSVTVPFLYRLMPFWIGRASMMRPWVLAYAISLFVRVFPLFPCGKEMAQTVLDTVDTINLNNSVLINASVRRLQTSIREKLPGLFSGIEEGRVMYQRDHTVDMDLMNDDLSSWLPESVGRAIGGRVNFFEVIATDASNIVVLREQSYEYIFVQPPFGHAHGDGCYFQLLDSPAIRNGSPLTQFEITKSVNGSTLHVRLQYPSERVTQEWALQTASGEPLYNYLHCFSPEHSFAAAVVTSYQLAVEQASHTLDNFLQQFGDTGAEQTSTFDPDVLLSDY